MQNILIKPVITEKAVAGSAKRFYSFFVHQDANKFQVKDTIEKSFKVSVDSVRIVNVKSKKKRRGRHTGRTPNTKKAIVKLTKDQKIEFFEKL